MEELIKEENISLETEEPKEIPEEKSKKKEIFSKIHRFLFKGWKKDLLKLWKLISAISFLVIVISLIAIMNGGLGSWKLNVVSKKANYKNYSHLAPDFSFRYPDYFAIDSGDGKNYGDNYMAGLKLATDPRTGCDVRTTNAGLNFQKSDAEIKNALTGELGKTAKDFQLVSTKRMKIGGENAFSMEFTFTDPIGSKAHLNQILTTHNGNNYMFICGTGDYQYQFFSSDFQNFIDSFQWKAKN